MQSIVTPFHSAKCFDLIDEIWSVESSFDGIMYTLTDNVLIGSLLGPALANIFVGFHEKNLQSGNKNPEFYFLYVDDTFCVCNKEMKADLFFSSLNDVHSALKFTLDNETHFSLLLVCWTPSRFHWSVFIKPTFLGLYILWNSFYPSK